MTSRAFPPSSSSPRRTKMERAWAMHEVTWPPSCFTHCLCVLQYERGRSTADFVKFLNEKCGTKRLPGGELSPEVRMYMCSILYSMFVSFCHEDVNFSISSFGYSPITYPPPKFIHTHAHTHTHTHTPHTHAHTHTHTHNHTHTTTHMPNVCTGWSGRGNEWASKSVYNWDRSSRDYPHRGPVCGRVSWGSKVRGAGPGGGGLVNQDRKMATMLFSWCNSGSFHWLSGHSCDH